VIAAASAAAPAAAGAAGILVRLPGGERQFGADDIAAAADRPAGTYALRAPGTAATPVAHPPALSVRHLVTLAGASADALTFVTIERPNGSLALLGRGDLTDPPPFPDGPPIVWMDAGGARYLRPLRGPDDANGADNIDVTGSDLVVGVHQGPLLVVRATSDRRDVRARTAVHFAAEVVSGATVGQALAYAWRFGDGATASGQTAAHAFAAPGVYEALVTVDGADDSGGSSAPVRIRVGAPPKTGGRGGVGTGDRRRSPAQGPAAGTGEAGGSAPATAAPAHTTPRPATTATTTTTASTPPPPTTSRRPVPRPRATRRARSRRAAPRGSARAPGRGEDKPVRGVLVSARVPAALPGAAPPAPASPSAAARRGADDRNDPFAPAAGVLAAIALVGLGIRRERRFAYPRREVG
jgi:hypothetical protein